MPGVGGDQSERLFQSALYDVHAHLLPRCFWAAAESQGHWYGNRLLSRDGKKYLPFPKEVIKRAMMFYDPAYYNNPAAIQHPEWGMDRINFQGWPYPSATELVVHDLKNTVLTGNAGFLDTLTPKHVAGDLVNYDFVKKALEANPKWNSA